MEHKKEHKKGTDLFLISRGSFPVIPLDEGIDWDLFYGSYVQTYLQQDIRDLARVGDETAFLCNIH